MEPLFAALKSGFDRGVLVRNQLPVLPEFDGFKYLQPLFRYWQDAGMVNCYKESITLTLAGQFWSVRLAQACIEVIQAQNTFSTEPYLVAQ